MVITINLFFESMRSKCKIYLLTIELANDIIFHLNPSSLLSYSSYNIHSVAVTHSGSLIGIGYNKRRLNQQLAWANSHQSNRRVFNEWQQCTASLSSFCCLRLFLHSRLLRLIKKKRAHSSFYWHQQPRTSVTFQRLLACSCNLILTEGEIIFINHDLQVNYQSLPIARPLFFLVTRSTWWLLTSKIQFLRWTGVGGSSLQTSNQEAVSSSFQLERSPLQLKLKSGIHPNTSIYIYKLKYRSGKYSDNYHQNYILEQQICQINLHHY